MTRERFIPYRRTDVIKMCQSDDQLSKNDVNNFLSFCKIITALRDGYFEFVG